MANKYEDSGAEQITNKRIGQFLKQKRIDRGLTQSIVAEKLGYGSPQFISNIERGISNVPTKSLKIFVELYQIDAKEVIDIILDEKRRHLQSQMGLASSDEANDSI